MADVAVRGCSGPVPFRGSAAFGDDGRGLTCSELSRPVLLLLQTPSPADQSFALGRYHLAAQQYAAPTSTTSLEEVVLKFVDVDEKDALRFYLGAKFDGLAKTVRPRPLLQARARRPCRSPVARVDTAQSRS